MHVDEKGAHIGSGQLQLPKTSLHVAQQTHLNTPKRHPLSPGRPGWLLSPPVPARGPSMPCRLCSMTCQEQGQPQVSPEERKQQSPPGLSVVSAGGETPVGWARGRGLQGRPGRVTSGLPLNSCSRGGTRFQGRFGAHLPHRYSFDTKPMYTVQWQVPALCKKSAFPARIMHISMPGGSEAFLMHRMTLNKALNPADIYSHAPCNLHLFYIFKI